MTARKQEKAAPATSSAPSLEAFMVDAGEGRLAAPLYILGDSVTIKISSRDTGGAFAVMEAVAPPECGPPLHLHRTQDEWFYILEGNYIFEVDGLQMHAGPGATVFAPRGSRHTFQNIGSTPARAIVTVVPGGIDIFFEELSVLVPPGTIPDPATLLPLFERHGLELLGPPLAAR